MDGPTQLDPDRHGVPTTAVSRMTVINDNQLLLLRSEAGSTGVNP